MSKIDDNEIVEINTDSSLEEAMDLEEVSALNIDSSEDAINIDDVVEKEEDVKEEIDGKETKSKKEKKQKKSLKERWNGLTKKKKIIIIVVSIIVLLLIIGIVLFLLLGKKDNSVAEKKVVFESDNYRYENGKLVFLDKNDKKLGTYECKIKDKDKCLVAKIDLSNDSFERSLSVDENDKELIKGSMIYLDNFVFVKDGDELFLYNINDKKEELSVNSFKAYNTASNVVVIENEDKKFGLIEIKEEGFDYLIRPSYDNLGVVNPTLIYLVAKDKDEQYIIDKEGKKISKNIYANIESVNNKYIVGKNNNTYALYDYENNEVLNEYDYIGFYDSIIAFVSKGKLYLRDNELNKLHEDGIKLNNTDYVKKYIYDKDNQLKDTKKAYDISVNNSMVNINIGEVTTNINLFEGAVNKNYNHINYFDGKLYFYGDEEKNDLIGTYSCKNKNNITKATDKLTNCKVYDNETGVSGIYNNDYVFIYDNMTSSNAIISLYSLKKRSNASTYNSINIVNKEELSEKSKLIYTSASYFIVNIASGSNKGNFGVHEINSDKVTGKVAFKYKSITQNGEYYVGVDTNDKYSLFSKNFEVIHQDFDKIDFYGNKYIGIKDNKLGLYDTNHGNVLKNMFCSEEKYLDISDTNYKFETADGSSAITIGGTTYTFNAEWCQR